MRLEQLRYYVAIADQGSIRKAAEALYVSQPNISRAIASLEDEVGAQLLLRNNHGVKLTKIGSSLYFYAKTIVSHMDAIDHLKDVNEQKLVSYLKVAVARIFLQDDMMLKYCSHIKMEKKIIHLEETNIETAMEKVRNLECEIGLVIINDYQMSAFKKILELQELEMEEIGSSPVYVHLSNQHDLMNVEHVHMKDLLPYDFLRIPQDFFSNFNDACAFDGISTADFTHTLFMNNYHSIINMINHTQAFMFGHKWQKDEFLKCRIASLPVIGVDIEFHLIWLKRKKEVLSEEGQFFIDMIKEVYMKM